jgi:hypothetical protein
MVPKVAVTTAFPTVSVLLGLNVVVALAVAPSLLETVVKLVLPRLPRVVLRATVPSSGWPFEFHKTTFTAQLPVSDTFIRSGTTVNCSVF